VTPRRAHQLNRSAISFLTLGVAWGPHVAFDLVVAACLIGLWVLICKRYAFLGILTLAFITGLIEGIIGSRGSYGYRYRRRRR
jgi:hypothetical protein